jgi:DNA repair exonuclease SbcCD ATPase subunit
MIGNKTSSCKSMSERPPAGDDIFDMNSFDEWLEELAQQKSVQKQDILNQMVSSYWILDDLMGLASETGAQSSRDKHGNSGDVSDATHGGEHTTLSPEQDGDEDPALFDGELSEANVGDTPTLTEVDTQAVTAILETLQENTDQLNEMSDSGDGPGVETLRNRLGEIEAEVQSHQTQFEELTDQLRTQDSELGTLFTWLENHDKSISGIRSQLRLEVKSLEAELDELEPQDSESTEKIADLESEIESIERTVDEIPQHRKEALDAIESQLRSDIAELEARLEASDSDADDASELKSDIESLEERIDTVEQNRQEAIRTLESDFATDMEALSQKLAELEPRAENIERLESAINTINSQIETLETQTERAASEEDITDITQQVVALEEETTNRFESLQTNLQAEFDQLKTILDELFDTQQRIESEMDALQSSYEEEVPPLTEITEDYTAVADLKDAANNEGISVAKCEGCNTTVDIGLLSRPNCPNCEAEFTDVSPKKGWFGGSDTLITESTKPPVPDDADFQ